MTPEVIWETKIYTCRCVYERILGKAVPILSGEFKLPYCKAPPAFPVSAVGEIAAL